jgi:superfamily II DNA or RNA helicase
LKVTVDSRAWIPKDELTADQLVQLRNILTIIPKKVGDHPGPLPKPVLLYQETPTHIGVPRQYFMERRKPRHIIDLQVTEGDKARWRGPVEYSSEFPLREPQRDALEAIKAKFERGTLGGILRAKPGWGKTVWSCAMIAAMNVPTLVIVHTEFLMDQWQKRIAQFLPDAQVGRVQGKMCDYTGKNIVMGMMKSLAEKSYPPSLYQWPGMVITDEVHRVGAATWSPVAGMFPARYRIGISATPRRKDGADNVFSYHIGRVLYTSKETRMLPKVRRVWSNFRLVKTNTFNPNLAPTSLLVNFLCASKARNRLILDQLVLAVKAGRKILLLSHRLKHLNILEHNLRKAMEGVEGVELTTGFFVGGMKAAERDDAEKQQVIFATFNFAKEGLDIPPLDTLFLVTPASDVEQAAGRILRPHDGKKDPVIVDFRDDKVSKFKRTASYRDKFYKRIGV